MKRTYTSDELETIREAVHAAAAQHHAAEQARGRSAVEDDPENANHTVGVAAWMISIRYARMRDDAADLERRIENGNGSPWTFHLMHRIEDVRREVAYLEGVHDAARFRAIFRETSV
ncbi:hypothetical protein [Curtobacterium flaccumfaciens]|uniref:hypothetical protein n=1 Tax=Curtobacterium flaccumfaciens TaxID=2035 RepID=UPI001889F06B|nr:hypothetical protein [Curtobacterium flaccumfaciens]MBF4629566.1 hypothetical protein [Curtobacterium flaccumfaciens]